jgi:hypothetical protein
MLAGSTQPAGMQTANVASKPYNATADQSCARQERDLTAFADRAGYEVVLPNVIFFRRLRKPI